MQKNLKMFGSVRVLCSAAVLSAVGVVVSYLCKFLTVTPNIRLTFENLPIILAGFVFGPLVGFVVGVCTDLISSLLFYGAGSVIPIITLGAGCVGLMSGLCSKFIPKVMAKTRLLSAVASAHIVGNMIVKSIGLMVWYGTPLIGILPRIPLYTVIAVVEFFLLWAITGSKALKNIIGELK